MSDLHNSLCQALQPRIAAYALGDRQDDSELEAHIATCATCQHQLRAYAQVTRVLPFSAPDVAPPAVLRERILAAAQPQVQAPTRRAVQPAPPRRPRWQWFNPPRLAFGAVCLALLAMIGWNVSLQRHLADQTNQTQALTQLLDDDSVQAYALAGDTGRGRLWASSQSNQAYLIAQGLPAPGADQVYQVWLIEGSTPTSVGLVDDQRGVVAALVEADQPATSFDAVGVTLEPRGGSPAPTSTPILLGTFAATNAEHLPLPASAVLASVQR